MEQYFLKGSDRIVTFNKEISYKVIEGEAEVFLALSYADGTVLRQRYIADAKPKMIIPTVSDTLTMEDKEYRMHFLIVPKGEVKLEGISALSEHREGFLETVKYVREKKDSSYKLCKLEEVLLEDTVYIRKKENEELVLDLQGREELRKKGERKILHAYHLDNHDSEYDYNASGEYLYSAVHYLGKIQNMKVSNLSHVKKLTKGEYTVEDIARSSGFLCREVELEEKFYKKEISPLIAFVKETGDPVAIYENTWNRKFCYIPKEDHVYKLTPKLAGSLDKNAYCIHRSLNSKDMGIKTVLNFALKDYSLHDLAVSLIGMLLVTLVNIMISTMHARLYDQIIPTGNAGNLYSYIAILIGFTIGSILFSISQNISSYRQNSRIKYSLQAAVYNRIFHMPEKFYRSYDSGELAYRTESATSSYYTLINSSQSIILQFVFSLFYLGNMSTYSGRLTGVAFILVIINMILTVALNQYYRRYQSKKSKLSGQIKSYLYQVFSGIETIRALGAEDAALSEYVDKVSDFSVLDYKHGKSDRTLRVFNILMTGLSTIIIYYDMVNGTSGMSTGIFMGFTALYASFSGAMTSIAGGVANIYNMLPSLKLASEILRTQPELNDEGIAISELKGDIKVSNLSFGYNDNNVILRDINFHIAPGEYVAIVGATGCGKSTLLRLLLGFEKPLKGEIYYDNIPLSRLSRPELRRNIGVVLQEGGLFGGSIYKNIKMSNPNITDEDVYQAIEEVGLSEDIANMPMGIMTPVSEDAQTISGGQKQRIMIARAIAGKPSVLFFDEATSSLDNLSQAKVTKSIDGYKTTRIVIAHRLSTIMNSDRILVLNKGRIEEEGTYEELIKKGGVFATLVRNQMV